MLTGPNIFKFRNLCRKNILFHKTKLSGFYLLVSYTFGWVCLSLLSVSNPFIKSLTTFVVSIFSYMIWKLRLGLCLALFVITVRSVVCPTRLLLTTPQSRLFQTTHTKVIKNFYAIKSCLFLVKAFI